MRNLKRALSLTLASVMLSSLPITTAISARVTGRSGPKPRSSPTALGYFRYQNDYADGFMVSTVRLGTKIGLFEGVGTDAATPMPLPVAPTASVLVRIMLAALK